tara:strand:+ start:724 stop:1677 length:954 start_codon:yes stop_codon:yes gene_type:complete
MEKTQDIIKLISDIKNNLNIFVSDGYFLKLGSFYRDDKKYINDVDISLVLNTDKLINKYNLILNIIKYFENNTNFIFKKYYCYYINSYFKSDYKIKDYIELNKNQIISNYELHKIKDILESNINTDIIKKKLSEILEINWNFKEIKENKKIINNITYNFYDSLKTNNMIWFDMIYKYNDLLIPIEFIITKKYNVTEKYNNYLNLYKGCKLSVYEYKLKDYYNFIKRLNSCYNRKIKRKEYFNLENYQKIYLFNVIKKLKLFLTNNEYYISKYNIKLTKFKLYDDEENLMKINNEFNNFFKNHAEKFYKDGVKHKLLF